ncbi:UPF0146 family protein [Methanobrevibacter olleyae]|uniref:UPF0146 protein YLM1_1261 n=1 Tax=Methanobrevibacter olleyae TaxID=294671 RepID=A0A126R166_METOL|nr:UPF0146 family protein [Methanobrevibacter olleyae]AMK15818.1 hypothetical protein YLM1_1261 [Methanobrevibacter olleyae]
MWNDLEEYILKLAIKNSQKTGKKTKIVEIGVGKFQTISKNLSKNDNIDLIMTDIDPDNENITKDDVFNPNMNIYKNADILFSIRPPAELQEAIMKIRDKINATLIIKPLFNEDLNIKTHKMQLKNYNRASFYIYEK